MEELVSTACKSFTGELEGTYYALGSMTEEERKEIMKKLDERAQSLF